MKAIFAIALLLLSVQCAAREAVSTADDPVLEKRVVDLTSELRCLVCQNQSLADSHADLAIDLKNQVRGQMLAGKSDTEIRNYMVARYGDFVLLKPPFNVATLMLWISPLLLLLGGAWMALRAGRAAPRAADRRDRLSASEQARLETVLKREVDDV